MRRTVMGQDATGKPVKIIKDEKGRILKVGKVRQRWTTFSAWKIVNVAAHLVEFGAIVYLLIR
jgi:hypothetical protein